MYQRDITTHITQWLQQNVVIILYGARQIGKTTLLQELVKSTPDSILLNCERPEISGIFENIQIPEISLLFQNKKLIILDEAQTIPNIGKVLKILYDSPDFDIQIIATGSSSFELSNSLTEPLTGRHYKLQMFPLLLREIVAQKTWLWAKEHIDELLLFGMYPGIIDKPISLKANFLSQLAHDYLYKDVLMFERVKNPLLLRKLLQLLALQLGSQVSLHELAQQLGVSVQTIERYIDLLEKSFVIFSLTSFNRNMRNEIKKSKKYYFYDLGIRNALISNFASISNRLDKGGIWENFVISERIKYLTTHQKLVHFYFWRTYDGAEIDLIEEQDGKLRCYECKYTQKRKTPFPQSFVNEYKPVITEIITPQNIHQFLLQ